MTVLAALLIAVHQPVLGAIADAGGPRKPWLLAFMLMSCAATAGLWFVAPEHSYLLLALALVLVANVCNEIAQAFYNAMLPDLASQDQLGRWSGWGWGLGYIAGIVALSLILVVFVQPKPPLFGLERRRGGAGADHRAAARVLVLAVLAAAVPGHARQGHARLARSARACGTGSPCWWRPSRTSGATPTSPASCWRG